METHFSLLDGIILALYFSTMMGMGFLFRRGSTSVAGFTAANNALPGWLCGLSILATYVSSISFLALPGKAYASNWNSFVFSLSLPVATWIGVKWFLPFYRNSGFLSAYSHLEKRFGTWARIYASSSYLIIQLTRMAVISYLMALPLNVLLGWNIQSVILLTTIFTTIYALVGGITAVIWADALQTVILVLGALFCLGIMIYGIPGGMAQLWEISQAHGKFSLGSFGWSLAEPTFWVMLLFGLTINLQNFGIDQNYIQRYHVSRSDKDARQSLWLGGLMYIPLSAVFFFIGTALFAYYTARPEDLAEAYQSAGKADSVFPYFIVTALPSGVTGLLIAAIFSAAMSTISTSLNSSATIILNDFYRRFAKLRGGEREEMLVLRLATLAWAILAFLIAWAMSTRMGSALDAAWILAGIFNGGMLGLFLFGFLSSRTNISRGAVIGVMSGITVIFWTTLSSRWTLWPEFLRSPFHDFLTVVLGTLTTLIVGMTATLIIEKFFNKTTANEIQDS
jgi:solute:Na+ symporter, SSS family